MKITSKKKKILKTAGYVCAGFFGIVFLLIIISLLPLPGNYKVLSVLSGSMEPAIKTGSIVFVRPVGNYKVNDIITFPGSGVDAQPITHRIVETKEAEGTIFYKVKGDANDAADWQEVPREEVIGKVLFSIPFFGYLLSFAKQPIGFILLIWVPVIMIIWEQIGKVRREISKNKKVQAVQELKSIPVAEQVNLEIKKEIDSIKKVNKKEKSEEKKSVKRARRKRVKNIKIDEKKY